MAIQFARVERVSRSQGKNACCKSAYNARARISDLNTNITYTFERLTDNVYHEILLPEYVDLKFKDVALFSNEVERIEKRKNSQLYKEYVLALPDDARVSLEMKKEMIYEFINSLRFIEEGLGVQVDLHRPHQGTNNWHAHLLVPTRRFKEDGLSLGDKARDLDPQVRGGRENAYVQSHQTINMGEIWKEIQNKVFEEHGLEIRVDEISNQPGVHMGPVRMRGLMNEASQFYEERRVADLPIIEDAHDLLNTITKRNAVFDRKDLEKQMADFSGHEQNQQIIKEALSNKRTIPLYHLDGRATDLFTTKEVRAEEERTIRIADQIEEVKVSRSNAKNMVDSLVKDNVVTVHQGAALLHLLGDSSSPPSLRVLRGRAGTGKSYVLGQLKILLEPHQNIIALAPTHKAVEALKTQGYNPSTIKSFLFKYKNGKIDVPQSSLFVVDEAGMIGTETYLELFKVVRATKSEIILVGCEKQLTSIERGGLFAIMANRYEAAFLEEVIRQRSDWGKEVSHAFSVGDISHGIFILKQHNKLNFDQTKADSMLHLLEDWAKSPENLADRLIIAISNKDVDALNKGAREYLKSQGIINCQEFEIENNTTKAMFGCGDRIVVTKTDRSLGVKNGEFGRIEHIDDRKVTIIFDAGHEIIASPVDLTFKHGYAATFFKSQGASILDVYVAHDGFSTKNNSYVGMSRHVKDLHVYCNRDATCDEHELSLQFAKVLDKGSSLNYLVKSDITETGTSFFDSITTLVKEGITAIGDRFHKNEDYYIFDEKEYVAKNTIKAVIQDVAQEMQQASGMETVVYTATYKNTGNEEISTKSTQFGSKGSNNSETIRWNDEVARIRKSLQLQAERVTLDLLGEPNTALSTANTLRFGSHGKMVVEIRGSKAGIWHDFIEDRGGDLLGLIAKEKDLDFQDVLNFAKQYDLNDLPSTLGEKSLRKMAEHILVQEKSQKLTKLYAESEVIDETNTLACGYLEGKCAISHENIVDDIRFIDSLWNSNVRQKMPAMIYFARDGSCELAGAGVVYLDKDTGDKLVKAPERVFGNIAGSYVEIQQANIGITILVEGVEDALSLKEANVPGCILASLGIHNFKNYVPRENEVVLIAANSEAENHSNQKVLENSINCLQEKGAKVLVVQNENLGDFNDVLKNQGKNEIYEPIIKELQPYCSRDWLDVWEKGDRLFLSEEEMLNNTDGAMLKEQYRCNFYERKSDFAAFIEKNQDIFAEINKLDLKYDLNSLKTKIYRAPQENWCGSLLKELSFHQRHIQDQTERASTPHGFTKEEFTNHVEKNIKYLEDGFKGDMKFARKGFGVEDFNGNKYAIREEYLLALGQDRIIQPLIDYNSELGKQIKMEVENNAIKEAKIAKLAAATQEEQHKIQLSLDLERASTPYGITRQEFINCVEKNVKYLDDGFKGDMKFMQKDFGVKDFDGNKYIVPEEYLSALGQNKKLQPLIDKNSELGQKIEDSVEHQKFLERMRENDRGRDM